MGITRAQYDTLMKPLNASRVAKRQQGGKNLSYLESWDVRAHLIRVFGFGNFDVETVDQYLVGIREYMSKGDESKNKPPVEMVEPSWFVKIQLTIRDEDGNTICRYSESAVGSTAGPANMIGEHHDNAVKTAASDALKRCAINLGTQFGLSLYDSGLLRDVVKGTLVAPVGEAGKTDLPDTPGEAEPNAEQIAALAQSLGATVVEQDA